MTEEQSIFLVLCLIYLSECVKSVPVGSVIFHFSWSGRWRVSLPNEYLSHPTRQLIFLNPIPALRTYVLAHSAPISVSTVGVSAATSQRLALGHSVNDLHLAFTHEHVRHVESRGQRLLVNGLTFGKCGSETDAQAWVALIQRTSHQPIAKREQLILEFLLQRFTKQSALQRLHELTGSLTRLRLLCFALFIFLYLIAPLAVSMFGLPRAFLPLGLALGLGTLSIAATYFSAHSRLYPNALRERIANAVKITVYPPLAIRAVDHISMNAMTGFHPVLLGVLLLNADAVGFVRHVLKNLEHVGRNMEKNDLSSSIMSGYAQLELKTCRDFLRSQYLDVLEKIEASPPWDGVSRAYCPRCLCYYTIYPGECADCRGVALRTFNE